jgi:hypothetical protein
MRTRGAGQSALLLLDVVEILDLENIEYAVIGALAASIHGAVRASMDADLVLSLATRKPADLESLLKSAGFSTALSRGDFEDPIPALLKISDGYDNRVDLLLGLRGMEPAAFTRTVSVPFQDKVLRFVGREDFIAMKAFAGGPQDIQDASRAIMAAKGSLDQELLQRLVKRYGRDAVAALNQLLEMK